MFIFPKNFKAFSPIEFDFPRSLLGSPPKHFWCASSLKIFWKIVLASKAVTKRRRDRVRAISYLLTHSPNSHNRGRGPIKKLGARIFFGVFHLCLCIGPTTWSILCCFPSLASLQLGTLLELMSRVLCNFLSLFPILHFVFSVYGALTT